MDKPYFTNEVYSGSAFIPTDTLTKGIHTPGANTMKSLMQMVHVNAKRAKVTCNRLASLQARDSPLIYAELNAFINFEGFMKYLTHEEQQHLIKYLPSVDIVKTSESLNSMFISRQFLETLSCFQQLLCEGAFDLSFAGANAEECKILRRLLLQNSSKHWWLECYQIIKDPQLKKINGGHGTSVTQKLPGRSNLASIKRKHDKQNQNLSDLERTMASRKRACRPRGVNPPSKCSTQLDSNILTKATDESENFADNDTACFSP